MITHSLNVFNLTGIADFNFNETYDKAVYGQRIHFWLAAKSTMFGLMVLAYTLVASRQLW